MSSLQYQTDDAPKITRRRVMRSFKNRGLSLQAGALDGIESVLNKEPDAAAVLDVIVQACKEQMDDGSPFVVTTELMASVVANLARTASDVNDEAMQLLNASETPRLKYDALRKQFTLESKDMKRKPLFGQATDKVDMLAQRFALVQQRILKQAVFRPKLVTADGRQASSDPRHVTHSLTPIESLLGRTGVKFLLGMIVQVEEGQYYLEDETAQVKMDFSDAAIVTDGIFTEHCIVLVEGEMMDSGILHVHRMGHPIVETRADAIQTMGLAASDLFCSMSTLSQVQEITRQEVVHGPEGMLVLLSHVHLDKPGVLDKLKTMFEGFIDANPVYILMGNFMSSSDGTDKEFMGYMDDLCRLITSIPGLAREGRFVFCPGPSDPGGIHNILPRPPLPKYCTRLLRSSLPHAVFTSNPCRLRFWSKEIVLYRNNVTPQLQRASLMRPPADRVSQHVVKTLLDQGHLAPQQECNYWSYDHVLRLYPLPDAILLGDAAVPYYENYASCDVVNPGSFSGDGDFVVYRPIAEVLSTKDDTTKSDVEFSQIGS